MSSVEEPASQEWGWGTSVAVDLSYFRATYHTSVLWCQNANRLAGLTVTQLFFSPSSNWVLQEKQLNFSCSECQRCFSVSSVNINDSVAIRFHKNSNSLSFNTLRQKQCQWNQWRILDQRLREQRRQSTSAVCEHQTKTSHSINWDGFRASDQEESSKRAFTSSAKH